MLLLLLYTVIFPVYTDISKIYKLLTLYDWESPIENGFVEPFLALLQSTSEEKVHISRQK